MSSAVRYQFFLRPAAWFLLAAALVAGSVLLLECRALSSTSKAVVSQTSLPSWPLVPRIEDSHWLLFRSVGVTGTGTPAGSVAGGPLSQRFRLAGTFAWTSESGNTVRKAILDNLQTKEEHIAAESDRMGTVEVVRILDTSVLLRENGRDEELCLSYQQVTGPAGAPASKPATAQKAGMEGSGFASTNRFGEKVGEGRWVMNRQGLVGYIQEISEAPARLEKLFDSMVPVYETGPDGRRIIGGYRLNIVGEREFYESVGLAQGDVVRTVNQMPISNKQKAMYWIDQFRQNRENSFVFEIERNGSPTKVEYLVR